MCSDSINYDCCGPAAQIGPNCPQCIAYKKYHYAAYRGDRNTDIFVICSSPHLHGPSSKTDAHDAWSLGVEKTVRDLVTQTNKYSCNITYTYAVRCEIDKPTKKTIDACSPQLTDFILQYKTDKPPIILALGKEVLQALGLPIKGKFKELQGRILKLKLGGHTAYVIPTMSKRQLLTKSGYMPVLQQHIQTALDLTQSTSQTNLAAIDLTLFENYVYPKTLEEVSKLVDMILTYKSGEISPENWMISIDTETNTVNPHRKKLKMLTFIVAWDVGKAASIPIEHPEAAWTYADILPYIKLLCGCMKPKVMHNAKYDLRVLKRKGITVSRLGWDTMISEHLLHEDKSGYYNLKQLTKDYLPQYGGYEEEVRAVDHIQVKGLKGAAKKLAEDDGYANVPLDKLNLYGCIDGDVTLQLAHLQRQHIVEESNAQRIKQHNLHKATNGSPRFKHLYTPACNLNNPLIQIMYHRALPLTRVLADMETHGMAIDRGYLEQLAENMDIELIKLKSKLDSMVLPGSLSDSFNPNSTPQVTRVLFYTGYAHPETQEIINYKERIPEADLRKTATGAISVDAGFLRYLKNTFTCTFASTLLDYRAVYKARSTFIENMRVKGEEDGRMHTSFNITGTATGRLSSSDENMQNIPHTIRGHNIKKVFIPSQPDRIIVNADAKAAEVRLYAGYSKDANLIKALNDGMDPHSFFASTVYNPESVAGSVSRTDRAQAFKVIGIDENHPWSYADFQKPGQYELSDPLYSNQLVKLRKNIKRVVFGILYGASEYKIGSIVGISNEQAQAIINVLFKMFPTIKTYIEHTVDQVKQLHFVETFLGRKRRFPNYDTLPFALRSKAQRQAVNFKIQSTSSDIVMDVLCSMAKPIKYDFGGQLLITVHDSVVFELPTRYISQITDFITEYGVNRVASNYPWLPVPFQWDTEVGPSYGEVKPIVHTSNTTNTSEIEDYEEHSIREELKSA
jgi:DNA polymerase I-like protein with 3'-5' exonuclease and polymerase domains/uracil-DNA glycosylase